MQQHLANLHANLQTVAASVRNKRNSYVITHDADDDVEHHQIDYDKRQQPSIGLHTYILMTIAKIVLAMSCENKTHTLICSFDFICHSLIHNFSR